MARFQLPKCTLTISGTDDGGAFGTSQHDKNVPKLAAADPSVQIDPQTANAVVKLSVSSGKLEAFRRPGSEDTDKDVAIVSLLTVDHPGEIIVTATSNGSSQRTLRLKPGTDIAIANVAVPPTPGTKPHFPIYGQLTKTKAIKNNPQQVASPNTIAVLKSKQHIFTLGFPINDGTAACGNQGCCKP